MSILSRITRIVRANLGFGKAENFDPDDQNRYRQKRQAQSSRQAEDAKSSQKDRYQNDEDTELAGHYANLEVPYGADLETVTHSWKQLLRKYHPDMHSNDPEKLKIANQLVQELNRSYQFLKENLEK